MPLLLPPLPSPPKPLTALTVGTSPLGVPVRLLKREPLRVKDGVVEAHWEGVVLLLGEALPPPTLPPMPPIKGVPVGKSTVGVLLITVPVVLPLPLAVAKKGEAEGEGEGLEVMLEVDVAKGEAEEVVVVVFTGESVLTPPPPETPSPPPDDGLGKGLEGVGPLAEADDKPSNDGVGPEVSVP